MNQAEAPRPAAPLWTKSFLFICLTNLFMFTSFYFLLPTLPVFVTSGLGGDESSVGYIIGILSLTAVMVRPLSGYLLDVVGRKKVLFLALIAFCLATAAYYIVAGLTALFLLRALHGMAWGFTTTGASTVAADVVPAERRGEGLGYYGLSNTLAMAAGPSLGLFVLDKGGFPALFGASLILAVLGLLSLGGVSYEDKTGGQAGGNGGDAKKKKAGLSLAALFEPAVFSLSAVMAFVAIVYGGIVSFITLLAKEIGVPNAGVYFLVYALTLLVIRPWAGRAFDRQGPKRIMLIGFVSMAAAFALLFLAKGIVLFVLSAVVMGVGFGIVQPTLMAMAINRVPPFRRGAANGTLMSAFDLGIGLGSIALGYVSKLAGFSGMYLACAAIIVIPALLFFRLGEEETAAL
ncbi:quinolone resistance protein, putative [Heliomicrobium modesticaldum Ice1]|uniref:Quinolone resistance protein, putative n=1 Tax=Heliobacterium modesticaldum (strain ATCC 51547 / Ice1) TaxID=498761 RepID=B0TEA9_HELMI|nr:MFS transporter [Heliomicrobium modesticaldum]ABZ85591.1 quinolone resistance protein, putative [Heliomicrobium modesticaldum Ice1]